MAPYADLFLAASRRICRHRCAGRRDELRRCLCRRQPGKLAAAAAEIRHGDHAIAGSKSQRRDSRRSSCRAGKWRRRLHWRTDSPAIYGLEPTGPPQCVGRRAFRGLFFSHPLSSSISPTDLPVPPPEASWAAPRLPLLPANTRGDSLNRIQAADDSTILSDVDPAAWIPYAQYANRSTRRGGRRASEPELSPAEEIRWTIYNHNLDVLAQLEPRNRLLFSMHDERWVPSQSHIRMLREEIERTLRQRRPSYIEPHHNLP